MHIGGHKQTQLCLHVSELTAIKNKTRIQKKKNHVIKIPLRLPFQKGTGKNMQVAVLFAIMIT